MKKYTKDEMKNIYKLRRDFFAKFLREHSIDVAVIIDNEDTRDANLRYFCGHICDGILIIKSDSSCVLIPWDVNLAKDNAFAEKIIPFTRYERDTIKAVSAVLNALPAKNKMDKKKCDNSPTTKKY